MRRFMIVTVLAVAAAAVAAPAVAKMPGFEMLEGDPPVAGEPHTMRMALSFPLPEGMTVEGVVEFASPIPGEAPLAPVFAVGPGGQEIAAEVTFPSPGTWMLVAFPGTPDREWIAALYPDGSAIEVLPKRAASAAADRSRAGGARQVPPVMLGGILGLVVVAGGFAVRRAGRLPRRR